MLLTLLLAFIAFLVGADELMLGPILEPIGLELGVKPERVTLFITTYSVALAIVAPLFGALSDKVGRRAIILPAIVVFGGASIATGLVTSFEWGLVARVVTGIASAGMLPIAFAIAASSGGDALKRIGWVQAGLTLGMISSPAFGAFLTHLMSWRAAFVALGIASWVVALLLTVNHRAIPNDKAGEGTKISVKLWQIPGVVGALLTMCIGLGGGIGLFNLVGQHLRDTQALSVWFIGVLYALLGLVSVAGNLMMPKLATHFESGRQVMRASLVVCLIASSGLYWYQGTSLIPLYFLMTLWALAGGIGAPALQAYISELSPAHRGVLISLAMSMMHIGVASWSAVAGFAYSLGVTAMTLLAITLFSLAILCLRPVKGASI
ncbi:MFS transporter [Pseudoalteromonas sp. CO348]|uniref:MFS transporter n=1 Tax=Pseudoalteromonas sp. CO348 TaxID=1777271 RepID=UPI00102391E8|nr:MFS transporter [Pseudoalteromonas sp. CO348]RZF98734.1 MFS transporter [Pseudoalteromonas sp. CO348]